MYGNDNDIGKDEQDLAARVQRIIICVELSRFSNIQKFMLDSKINS